MQQTLPRNLEQIANFPQVELVLVDYSSPDGFHDWLIANYSEEIKGRRIRYFRVPGQTLFNRSHARNVAWKNATGDIRFNLDADVALETGAMEGIYRVFQQRPGKLETTGMLFVDPAHMHLDLWGCIAAHRRPFYEVGGYNEEFGARWGLEDDDLVRRLAGHGVEFFELPHAWFKAFQHGDEERIKFHTEDRETGLAMNKVIQQMHARLGSNRVNSQREWGAGGVQVIL